MLCIATDNNLDSLNAIQEQTPEMLCIAMDNNLDSPNAIQEQTY